MDSDAAPGIYQANRGREPVCDEPFALEVLTKHRKGLFCLALKLTRNAEAAEDLVQETLIRAIERAATFHGSADSGTLYPWLCAILRNLFYNAYRRKQVRAAVSQPLNWDESLELSRCRAGGTSTTLPEQTFLDQERLRALHAAIRDLPPFLRSVLELAAIEELSYEEIGVRLNLPGGTVRSRLNRARTRLARATAAWLPVADTAWSLPTRLPQHHSRSCHDYQSQ